MFACLWPQFEQAIVNEIALLRACEAPMTMPETVTTFDTCVLCS